MVEVEKDATAGAALISLRDTGVGFNAEMASRLFEPFSQADTTLDRSKGGLGLGLALVKGLVESHGGTVSARSEGEGKGAEFVVRLPLEQKAAEADAATGRAREPGFGRHLAKRSDVEKLDELLAEVSSPTADAPTPG